MVEAFGPSTQGFPHLGLPRAIGDQAHIFHGAMAFTQLLQLWFGAGEGQPRDEHLVFLYGRVVLEHLMGETSKQIQMAH